MEKYLLRQVNDNSGYLDDTTVQALADKNAELRETIAAMKLEEKQKKNIGNTYDVVGTR